VREFIIPADAKTEPPAKAAAQAPAMEGAAPVVILPGDAPRPRFKTPSRQRDFIIQYDGQFIGHFRALRPVTPRFAFGQVARELRAQRADFAPERLALFRPVKLRIHSHAAAEVAAAGGAFVWFAEK